MDAAQKIVDAIYEIGHGKVGVPGDALIIRWRSEILFAVSEVLAKSCDDCNCNEDREAKMIIIKRDDTGKPTVWCDPCIAPIVKALNDAGICTRASCCGHGRQDGSVILRDGRELVIRQFDPKFHLNETVS